MYRIAYMIDQQNGLFSAEQQINDYRDGLISAPSSVFWPNHEKRTTYQYNSQNQVIKQSTPNGGTTLFWYDEVGRLVLSQNEEQRTNHRFSYTFYDNQTRIAETGEVAPSFAEGLMFQFGLSVDDIWCGIDYTIFNDKIVVDGDKANPNTYITYDYVLEDEIRAQKRKEVVKSFYDNPVLSSGPAEFTQDNLRSRIATSAYYPSLPSNQYLLGTYPSLLIDFDGSAFDQSGNNHHGIINTGSISEGFVENRFGAERKAYEFNHTSDIITVPHESNLNFNDALSVSIWIKSSLDPNNVQTIVAKSDGAADQRSWLMSSANNHPSGDKNKLRIILSEDGTNWPGKMKQYYSSVTVFDNAWHYVTFTFKKGDLKIYIDGQEDLNVLKDIDDPIGVVYANDEDITIGHHLANGVKQGHLTGFIDDPR